MTSFGHTMIGIACGSLMVPSTLNLRPKAALILLFAAAANVPDIEVQGWGHDRYYFSHSLFVNLGAMGLILAMWTVYCVLSRHERYWKIAAGLSCAWMSHLLLDSFYNHGAGIRIFWPLSDAALALPIPWLSVRDVSIPYFAWSNLKVYLTEAATFAPLLILSIIIHRCKPGKPVLANEDLDSMQKKVPDTFFYTEV